MKALCIVIGIFLLATAQGEAQERGYAPGRIILSFENKEDAVLEMSEGRMTCMFSTVMSILERYEATWMRRLYSGNKGAQNIYLIELSSDAHVNPAIAEFRNDPAIKSAMRNYAIEFLAKPNDWYFNNDYTIKENDYPEASGIVLWDCPLEITVDSCTVNMNYRGIWASNARPTISWSEIACNQEDGIWVTSYRYPQPYPYPTIHRCRIFLNGESGIHCLYNKAQVSYTKSHQNGSYGLLAYGVYAYPEVDHSKIVSNAVSGRGRRSTGSRCSGA